MRILLTGKNGQLGWELHRQLERDHEVIALGREDIDFRDSRFLFQILKKLPKLDLIVNTAAYTEIDKAEQEPFVAEAINSEAAALLATEAEDRGIPMIHFSTDYVFDGRQWTRAYHEKDQPNPTCYYGWTKLEGEDRIRNILEKHLIFRLSGLYGTRRKNFFTTMLQQNRNGIIPRVVNDQIISPNWTPLVAEAVVVAIQQLFQGEKNVWGTYHLSGIGQTTWYEFARLIIERINDRWNVPMPFPIPVSTEEYGVAAKRPKFSVLDSTRFNNTFQCILPDWQEQFLLCFGGLDQNRLGGSSAKSKKNIQTKKT